MSHAEYSAQLEAMAERCKRWRAENADKQALVQFNFPAHVAVIAPISDAIHNHFVTVNEAGLELIKALGNWGELREPTVLMVRVVLENG